MLQGRSPFSPAVDDSVENGKTHVLGGHQLGGCLGVPINHLQLATQCRRDSSITLSNLFSFQNKNAGGDPATAAVPAGYYFSKFYFTGASFCFICTKK